jgi:pimeloyl-ACP methyl ester carboxylesterase
MSLLKRDDVEIYYEVHGNSSNPTIFLSHGYSATSAMWRSQVAALQDQYQVIVWDMRGHGSSSSPEDGALYSEALTVDDMAALLDEVGVEQAVIGGLSLGGYMTLAFHATYPERCSALMLFDTGPGYKSDKGREAWNKTAELRARSFERDGLGALGEGEEVRVAQHKSAAGLALAARGMLAQINDRVIQSLPSIEVNTLVLVGAQDEPFLIPTDYMSGKIANTTKVVIDNAGHASNIDQPEAFNQAVFEFLKSL